MLGIAKEFFRRLIREHTEERCHDVVNLWLHPSSTIGMPSFTKLLPLLASLALLSESKPLSQPSVVFTPLQETTPGSAQNIVVDYYGDVDGELTITYAACDDTSASILSAKQRIGQTHVGAHPLARRHEEHENRRPNKFVWLTPAEMSGGCLHAFLDGELIGKSEELVVTKRYARRQEKKSFVDVAGVDSNWFDGVAYLQQKQPDEVFVASVKNRSFGILGGGISGLATSVRNRINCGINFVLTKHPSVDAGLCWYSQLEDHRVVSACWWSHSHRLPQRHVSRRRSISRARAHAFPV
jgi:hypothetical protein